MEGVYVTTVSTGQEGTFPMEGKGEIYIFAADPDTGALGDRGDSCVGSYLPSSR